jgi:hypothetical protein
VVLKNLRQNLLNVPPKIYTLQKVNTFLNDPSYLKILQADAAQDIVGKFLHSSIFSLFQSNKNRLDQQPIINAVFNHFEVEKYHDLENEYQKAITWFSFLPNTPANANMKAELKGLAFKRKKVYISSTFRDLKDYRQILIQLFEKELSKKFELSDIMEKMFDDGAHALFVDECQKAVLDSDIYFLILGNRVGSYPPGESRTYTEIEYDTAVHSGKKIFLLRLEHFDEKEIDNKSKHDEILKKFEGKPSHEFENEMEFENVIAKAIFAVL